MLVTVIFFSYNQEKVVSDALKSALNQDYNDIEFIISDDSSKDMTYENILELLGDYPREKIAYIGKNSENLGIHCHMSHLLDLAKGELAFIFAGDDISDPSRVSHFVKKFKEKKFKAACSSVSHIGSSECSFSYNEHYSKIVDKAILINSKPLPAGCSAVYHRSVYKKFPKDSCIDSEDVLLFFIAGRLGEVYFSEKKLVSYRSGGVSRKIIDSPAARFVDRCSYISALSELKPYFIEQHMDLAVLSLMTMNSFRKHFASLFVRSLFDSNVRTFLILKIRGYFAK